ncbi:MAG: acetate/propionate family kinase [bacterium]|nr:acetate/propionate family kinase [bacterium]
MSRTCRRYATGPGRASERVRVLSLNGGSSSLKAALWEIDAHGEVRLADATVSGLGIAAATLRLRDGGGVRIADAAVVARDPAAAVPLVADAFTEHGFAAPEAVGHRLVHGGPDLGAPTRVDDGLLATLRRLVSFAPLHLPAEIASIEAVAARAPALPQVVCFDTAFHRGMPDVARRLPLPRAAHDAGIRRYGFHGLSYEYVCERVGGAAAGRLVMAHLGNGASLAAVRDGKPVDTTMGLTPTGGLMMGTRTGDLDPGALVHWMRAHDAGAEALARLVDHESGLAGVSGTTADMQALLAARATSVAAAEAVDLFCWIARKHVGAMAASLGGLDTLVFTGGIGERGADIRAGICAGLEHLGVELDAARNASHAPTISLPGRSCAVRIVPTDEDRMIARHTHAVLAAA